MPKSNLAHKLSPTEVIFLNRICQKLYGDPNRWRLLLEHFGYMSKVESFLIEETHKQRKNNGKTNI